jgi:hypothetical protein
MGVYADAYLEWVWERREKRDQRWARYPARFWVSSLGSCHIKQIMQRLRVSGRPMTRKKMRFFEDRTAMHDLRIVAWWEKGLALTADLPDWHPDSEKAKLSLTKYMPDDFGGRPDIIGHLGDPKDVEYLRGCFWRAVAAAEQGDKDNRYAEELREVGMVARDMKTANPNMVKYADSFPKPDDVGQVGWYAHIVNDEFLLGIKEIGLVYCPIGSEEDDLEFELQLPPKEQLGIDEECESLVEDWKRFQGSGDENPWRRPLPPVLDLVDQSKKDATYGEVVFKCVPWQCRPGYCQYSGHGCTPRETEHTSPGDRFAVIRDGRTIYVEEWCRKYKVKIPSGAKSTRLAKDVR